MGLSQGVIQGDALSLSWASPCITPFHFGGGCGQGLHFIARPPEKPRQSLIPRPAPPALGPRPGTHLTWRCPA